MPGRRVAALQTAARHIADARIPLAEEGNAPAAVQEAKHALMELPGIGSWTAEFFALRALRDRDVWPGNDLILRRQLEREARRRLALERVADDGKRLRAAMRDMLVRWRPYRAYAALHLWHAAALLETIKETEGPSDRSKRG